MPFGSALEFSLFPLKRKGDLSKEPWANWPKGAPSMAWPAAGTIDGPRRTPGPRTPVASNDARSLSACPGARANVELPVIAQWNARFLPLPGRASPARLPFTPALLAKAHLFGKVRTRLGVIRRDHRIIRREAPFLAVFVR